MPTHILATKLYVPPLRPEAIVRPHLVERLNEGLHRRLTLISAPAGFGKSTLVSAWLASCERPAVWLSLDEGDNDPARFLTYFITALQGIEANIGVRMLIALQSPQPPSIESALTILLNDIMAIPNDFIMVLDDYHVIESRSIDDALAFLIEHLPPQMHLAIATREDPQFALARLRARAQLNELRVKDLRFTPAEAALFLNEVMGLNLSPEDVSALADRTEGWIAGLHLAAISMQEHQNPAGFIRSFTGSHQFVMDYLIEEVLQQQSEDIQRFLLYSSVLDRLCGPLCDAVLSDPAASGHETLAHLESANMFIIPLDSERRWYRYHHLFADLLRQRLRQSIAASGGDVESRLNELHIRASQWYEDNGFELDAFQHAAAGHDVERAERLIDGKGIPLHFKGAVLTVLDWFESLSEETLRARPWLWARHASLMLINGQTTGVEEKLQACEAVLQGLPLNDKIRNLIGAIANSRAVLALTRYDSDTMIAQSLRALEYLHPDNFSRRASANWTMGVAYLYRRDTASALQPLTEGVRLSQAGGDVFTGILATIGLGMIQEAENHLHQAAETYQRILQLTGDQPLQIINEVHLGLARIFYEWNDLEAAEKHGQQSHDLARQYDRVIDRYINAEVFLARLELARGEVEEATSILAQADQTARQKNFVHRIPEVAAAQALTLLRQGKLADAAHLAQTYQLPFLQARVLLAQGDPLAALARLDPLRQQTEAKNWLDERLRIMALQAVAYHMKGDRDEALQVLSELMLIAAPEGFVRLFIDEGTPMSRLLSEAAEQGIMPDYAGKLLAVFEAEDRSLTVKSNSQSLIEPLSERELEVLQLTAQGLSNREIGERLFLALSTVKGHNQRIFDKLQVQRRTEAIARARELGLL